MDDLEFQDHPYESSSGDKVSPSAPEQTVEFTEFPPDATQEGEDDSSAQDTTTTKPARSIFSLAYYQQFFDVDTVDVSSRVLWSMLPNPKRNLLEHVIRPNPDLYGPFWVCATLTFSIAISGNVADFFKTSGQGFKWVYDYHKVPLAATAIFGYWLIIPVGIWAILRWRGSLAGFTLTELICVYGYSLAIFIPCSILWLIPSMTFQYLVAAVCSLLSGATLLITLYPAVKNDSKQVKVIFLVVVVVLHALLAAGFVMYFFQYTSATPTAVPTIVKPAENLIQSGVNNSVHEKPLSEIPENEQNRKSRSSAPQTAAMTARKKEKEKSDTSTKEDMTTVDSGTEDSGNSSSHHKQTST